MNAVKHVQRYVAVPVALVLAVGGMSLRVPAASAASAATLDCSMAVSGGRVGVLMPSPGVAERTYLSRFWFKFDGGFAGTGHDWVRHPTWYFGDSGSTWFFKPPEGDEVGQWQLLTSNSWAFWGVWNTGRVYVWETQYDFSGNELVGHDLGSCVTYQFTVFYPFGG